MCTRRHQGTKSEINEGDLYLDTEQNGDHRCTKISILRRTQLPEIFQTTQQKQFDLHPRLLIYANGILWVGDA